MLSPKWVTVMADKLKVIIKNEQKEVKIQTGVRMLLRRCCHAILENENFTGSAEIEIHFMDREGYIRVSDEFCGETVKTEAFTVAGNAECSDGVRRLGAIYMSVEDIYLNAKKTNTTSQRRLAHLTAHGVLELLGYPVGKDIAKNDKADRALAQLGLSARPNYYYA